MRALVRGATQILEALTLVGISVVFLTVVVEVVLRYGFLYGPGTWYATDGSTCDSIRKRKYPIVGGGAGLNSMVHVSDAAAATALAVDRGEGIYNVVDDEPAAVSIWPGTSTTLPMLPRFSIWR